MASAAEISFSNFRHVHLGRPFFHLEYGIMTSTALLTLDIHMFFMTEDYRWCILGREGHIAATDRPRKRPDRNKHVDHKHCYYEHSFHISVLSWTRCQMGKNDVDWTKILSCHHGAPVAVAGTILSLHARFAILTSTYSRRVLRPVADALCRAFYHWLGTPEPRSAAFQLCNQFRLRVVRISNNTSLWFPFEDGLSWSDFYTRTAKNYFYC